ncbi:hypothetical protein DL767_003158 [Monosporascus sp. MG133]|nr:hypothetical protein DL767_003158 [Monosporascus sp. MG133]
MTALTPTCPEKDSPPEIIAIDADGDLHLTVGQHQHRRAVTYVVCSKALSRSSPVFKRLLYGGFAESKKPEAGGQWTVCLPEDEPAPMKIILNIAHGRFDQVPIKWDTVKDLYLLTVLTDKYDLTHLLRPWAQGWMRAIRTTYDEEKEGKWSYPPSEIAPQCLWIAWELGGEDSAELLVNDIAYGSRLNASGRLAYPWNKLALIFEDTMEPPGMVGE